MTALQHIYVTAHGSYTSGSWLGEGAQFGLRLVLANSTNMPEKGTTFTPMANGDVVTDQGQTAGTNGTLTRTWSARIGETGSNENADAAFQIDLAEDVRTFLYSLRSWFGPLFSWTAVKLAPVSREGKTIGTSSVYQLSAPIAGTATAMCPPQVAAAITLRANILGRRGRGRIYLPALSQSALSSDGTLVTSFTSALRSNMATLITNLQDAPGTPLYNPLVVVTSAGQATVVRPSEIRTGQRADTIRSRREQVAETYTSTAL